MARTALSPVHCTWFSAHPNLIPLMTVPWYDWLEHLQYECKHRLLKSEDEILRGQKFSLHMTFDAYICTVFPPMASYSERDSVH